MLLHNEARLVSMLSAYFTDMFLLVALDFSSCHGYIQFHVPRDWRTVVRRTRGARCEVLEKIEAWSEHSLPILEVNI